ncbi:tyrosine-type recombinase/integrase [Pseudorhodoferax sp. Leaf265]|uniref:tyrosine-type recombinase/integrase n=1 Tax=Pseudorhodoferax sp. Leaf265 TaxID=1736315 RepID=UPI0006F36FC8|nr:tyrosine-type recombinase/integrase [Pseudorhodoferax sp. Leaf265]KQP02511.1 hypothetical protein ASF45_20885 [Pseudorhodoferax sp. Leaf265]
MGRPRSATRRNWPEGLYQNAAGYFYYRDGDSGKTFGLGRDRAHAITEARAAFAKRAAEQSKSLLERLATSDAPSLAAWMDEWLERISPGLSKSTMSNHKAAFRELRARAGHLPVCDITPKMIADVLEVYTDSGRARMAVLIRASCMELFRAAETRGHLKVGQNPVTATRAKKSEVRRERLTLETFMAIHAAQKKPWGKRSMELALLTAQRRQDVAAMKRSDVVDGHLQVDQGKSGGKTKLGIPISLRLDAVGWTLSEVIKSCRTPGLLSHYLLHHRTKGGRHDAGDPVDDDTLSEAFAAARDAAGIKTAEGRTPPTFHEIRSLAIRLYTEQYGKEFAQALAGHKDVKMTDLYSDERSRQSVRVMVPVPESQTVLDKF